MLLKSPNSKLANSTVSVAVEPQLNDGRLVIKVAAKNGSSAPVAFGPGSIAISTVAGQPIALSSLQKLINDVRMAAGMAGGAPPGDAPTQGAYAMRQQPGAQDGSGRMDVTGYTGGSAIAPSETVRWSKHSLDRKTADAQIAASQACDPAGPNDRSRADCGRPNRQSETKIRQRRRPHTAPRSANRGDTHPFTIGAPSD